MRPLPKKGDFLQGHTLTDCNYVLLTEATQLRTSHEGVKPFLGYSDLSCFLLFGVEAGAFFVGTAF